VRCGCPGLVPSVYYPRSHTCTLRRCRIAYRPLVDLSRGAPSLSTLGSRSGTDRPIRVLWLTKGLGRGGAEWLLVTSARQRDRENLDVRTGYLLPHKVALVDDLEAADVPVTCLGRSQVYDARWLATLRRWLVDDPVDIVHAHNPSIAVGTRLVVRSLPRRLRPWVVVTDHNVWHGYARLTRLAEALTGGPDDARITVSPAVLESLPARLRGRAQVVLQGIEVDEVWAQRGQRAEVRAELGIDADTLVVGTVANLRPQKGYPDLLHAAREVIDKVPDVRFVAVGQGPQEEELRDLHARLGLGDRFQILGYRADAVRVMAACDVFVLASHWEGLGVAVMEALGLGLPVVVTEVGGIPEVVDDGREGLLVPPKQPHELAAALVEVLTDDERRRQMASAAAKRGEECSIENAVWRTEALYRELVRP
jgi:L-malate glycosyltransferase